MLSQKTKIDIQATAGVIMLTTNGNHVWAIVDWTRLLSMTYEAIRYDDHKGYYSRSFVRYHYTGLPQ